MGVRRTRIRLRRRYWPPWVIPARWLRQIALVAVLPALPEERAARAGYARALYGTRGAEPLPLDALQRAYGAER